MAIIDNAVEVRFISSIFINLYIVLEFLSVLPADIHNTPVPNISIDIVGNECQEKTEFYYPFHILASL